MTGSAWLAFTPRDTVFVRDGRSFDAQTDSTAATVRPGPTTIAGASGAVFGRNPDAVRGPVLARLTGGEWDAYFPAPADLIQTSDSPRPQVHRLESAEVGGQTDLDAALGDTARPNGERPVRWLVPPEDAEPAEPVTGLIPADTLSAYLAGTLPARDGTPLARLNAEDDPFKPERRVGLARDADRRARTGFLYQMTHLRSEDGWAFLAECLFSSDQVPSVPVGPAQFGGRARLADVSEAQLTWPQAPGSDQLEAADGRILVYLATPALWADGWRIPVPDGARLAAAACGKPVPVATLTPGPRWKQTRVLRWAVPAGSVYLLKFDDPAAGAKWAVGVHGTAHGPTEGDLGYMRTAGFGVVLTGVWS